MSPSIDGVPRRLPDPAPDLREPAASARAAPDDSSPSAFGTLLHGVLDRIEEGERSVHGANEDYATLDAASLIALQAGIYRYSEAVDLAAKLVDRTATSVRTVIQAGH